MTEYHAKYIIKASMMDGGVWMPDPDAHIKEYRFSAESDAEAQRIAEEYKPVLARDYFGPSITLDSLCEIREIKIEALPKQRTQNPLRISFSRDLGHLVTEAGEKYDGTRFDRISADSSTQSSREEAERQALYNVEMKAQDAGADAYEITSLRIEDSQLECDGAPYSGSATALVYKTNVST